MRRQLVTEVGTCGELVGNPREEPAGSLGSSDGSRDSCLGAVDLAVIPPDGSYSASQRMS